MSKYGASLSKEHHNSLQKECFITQERTEEKGDKESNTKKKRRKVRRIMFYVIYIHVYIYIHVKNVYPMLNLICFFIFNLTKCLEGFPVLNINRGWSISKIHPCLLFTVSTLDVHPSKTCQPPICLEEENYHRCPGERRACAWLSI